jgi:type IV secretory pathway VirJ component
MNKMRFKIFYIFQLALFLTGTVQGTEGTLEFGAFGTVRLYYQSAQPENVVLFVSGDGGWNLGVVDMARALSESDALVIGIDIVHYLSQIQKSKEECLYPAGDFELLSKYVQKKLNYTSYQIPVLIGYSSGATLVYAALVQAPSVTFKGALSMGFCPDLFLTKPLCHGNGLEWQQDQKKGYLFQPAANLEVPWIVMQGEIDQVCAPAETEKYVRKVNGAEIIRLPKVGHGFSKQKNWLPQFKQAFVRLASSASSVAPVTITELQDLPLVEVPAMNNSTNFLAVFISGDGGWAYLDKGLAQFLSENGIGVIGLNSLKYFWQARSPDEITRDVQRIIQYYLSAWKKERLILIGYSMGADVLPFIINRLPQSLHQRISLGVFLGISHTADFEFHFTNWIGNFADKNTLSVKPEFLKLTGIRKLCCYGEEDDDALCKDLDQDSTSIMLIKGGHRLGGNFRQVGEKILQEIK